MNEREAPMATVAPIAEAHRPTPPRPTPWSRLRIPLAVLALTILTLGVARITFGSIPVAIRYLQGERLILAPADLRVEGLTRARPVLITAEVRNYTSSTVRLLGSAANCACVTVKEMPDAIPAGGRSAIVLEARALPNKPDVNQVVVFFTDHPVRPKLGVHVTAKVRD